MRRTFAIIGVVAAILVAGCGDAPDRARVYLFGDSLVYEASEYWLDLMDESGAWEARQSSLPGTATCDFFDLLEQTIEEFHPEVVALSFSGNALSECMQAPDGSPLTDREYLDKYRADTETVIEMLGDHVAVFLVGAPASGSGDDRVFDLYRDIAGEATGTTFVDGGRIVSPDRTFVETLPCLPEEECDGPVVDGVPSNVVRSPDRGHFCPVEHAADEPCPVYSPGAYRFAVTIYEAITSR